MFRTFFGYPIIPEYVVGKNYINVKNIDKIWLLINLKTNGTEFINEETDTDKKSEEEKEIKIISKEDALKYYEQYDKIDNEFNLEQGNTIRNSNKFKYDYYGGIAIKTDLTDDFIYSKDYNRYHGNDRMEKIINKMMGN